MSVAAAGRSALPLRRAVGLRCGVRCDGVFRVRALALALGVGLAVVVVARQKWSPEGVYRF